MAYDDRDRVLAWLDAGHGEKFSTTTRIVLVTMAEKVNSRTGLAWPGHELMVTRWGISSATVKRAIAQLCSLGVLEIAEHGSYGRRSRYRLAGELIEPVESTQRAHAEPVTAPNGLTQIPLQPQGAHTDPVTPSGAHSVPVTGSLSTSNGLTVSPGSQSLLRSYSGVEDDDDGATPRAPLGSLGAAPTIGRKVSETLGYTDEQAAEWIETKLDGRTPSNVDAYLLRCLENHVADAARGLKKERQSRPSQPSEKSDHQPREAPTVVDPETDEQWPESIPRPAALADWTLDQIGDDFVQWESVAEIPFHLEVSEAEDEQSRPVRHYTDLYLTVWVDELEDTPAVVEIYQALETAMLIDRISKVEVNGYGWKLYVSEWGGRMNLSKTEIDGYGWKLRVPARESEQWIDRMVEAISDPSVQDLLQRVPGNLSTTTSDPVSPEEFR
jgi:hypothetical protein